jgi:hypothetical protein
MEKGPIDFVSTIRGSHIEHEGGPGVWIAAMNPLFPTPQKSEDLISIYSPGIRDFNP